MDDIERDLEEAIWDTDEFQGAPIATPNADLATQWLGKLNAVRQRKQEYIDAHRAVVERLNNRLGERTFAMDQEISWLEESLEMYHRTALSADSKRLTIDLPTGTLVSRKQPDRWEYEDESAYMEWALERGFNDTIDFPPAPDPRISKAAVKREFKDNQTSDGRILLGDGTVVPGVRITKGERKYEAKTEED